MPTITLRKDEHNLRLRDRAEIIESIRLALKGRADQAYLFGSFASENQLANSDNDINIVQETHENFVERPLEFGGCLKRREFGASSRTESRKQAIHGRFASSLLVKLRRFRSSGDFFDIPIPDSAEFARMRAQKGTFLHSAGLVRIV